jgi:hypothetical protein
LKDRWVGVVSQSRSRKRSASEKKAHSVCKTHARYCVVAHAAGGIDEVDSVDAVATASLRVVEHVVEDRQAAEDDPTAWLFQTLLDSDQELFSWALKHKAKKQP